MNREKLNLNNGYHKRSKLKLTEVNAPKTSFNSTKSNKGIFKKLKRFPTLLVHWI